VVLWAGLGTLEVGRARKGEQAWREPGSCLGSASRRWRWWPRAGGAKLTRASRSLRDLVKGPHNQQFGDAIDRPAGTAATEHRRARLNDAAHLFSRARRRRHRPLMMGQKSISDPARHVHGAGALVWSRNLRASFYYYYYRFAVVTAAVMAVVMVASRRWLCAFGCVPRAGRRPSQRGS
jgi:hypothetical protein